MIQNERAKITFETVRSKIKKGDQTVYDICHDIKIGEVVFKSKQWIILKDHDNEEKPIKVEKITDYQILKIGFETK